MQKPLAKKLSKGVLDLKFMKKSKEKAQLQEENEERQHLYQNQLSSLLDGADRIVMLNSYFDCMEFLPCRLSFGGMDPDIEKINDDKLTGIYKVIKAPQPETGTQMDTDVAAEEMATVFYQSSKRKSDHLDDYDTGTKRDLEDDASERSYVKGCKYKREGDDQFQQIRVGGDSDRGNGSNHDRGSFSDRGRGQRRANFRGDGRGRNQGRGNFRGKDRGRSQGRGNFRGNDRGQSQGRGNFRGNDRG
ncbi:M-phase phosphoprotein 6-like, partial [Homarus americanus]